jgi:molybdopterin-guanine dinucleotide biosynthesis protein A
LLAAAVGAIAEMCEEIVVVCPPDREPPLPDDVRVRVAHDARPHLGPLAGLVAGLSQTETATAVVVGGDMPSLVPGVLGELLRTLEETAADAAALADGPTIRPLPLAIRRRCLAMAQYRLDSGERSLWGFLEALDVRVVAEEVWRSIDPAGETLRDVDRPEDLPGRAT